MPSPNKTELMLQKIKSEKIPALYHFTDIDNLPLIAQLNGLHSKEFLEQKGLLNEIKLGGNSLSNDLDILHGNWNKVSLSWCSKLPMAYWREQQRHLCYLIFDTNLILGESVIFTDRNAAASNHRRNQGIEGLNLINFDAVRSGFPYPSEEIKQQKQAEILIPNQIELQQIKHVVFRSDSSLQEAKRICNNYPNLVRKFTVADRLFHLPSSFVQSHFLTSAEVTSENVVQNILSSETTFKNGNYDKITLVVLQKLIYGTKITARFINNLEETIFFDEDVISYGGEYWTWYEVESDRFSAGNYEVVFYLGNIRQFIIPFTVIE